MTLVSLEKKEIKHESTQADVSDIGTNYIARTRTTLSIQSLVLHRISIQLEYLRSRKPQHTNRKFTVFVLVFF